MTNHHCSKVEINQTLDEAQILNDFDFPELGINPQHIMQKVSTKLNFINKNINNHSLQLPCNWLFPYFKFDAQQLKQIEN